MGVLFCIKQQQVAKTFISRNESVYSKCIYAEFLPEH